MLRLCRLNAEPGWGIVTQGNMQSIFHDRRE